MKLHLADTRNRYTLTGYGTGYLAVNGSRYEHALIVTPDAEPQPWPVTAVATMTTENTGLLLANAPEIIIIGTGPTQVFPEPAQLRTLLEARVGLEIMNTPAACRTYNVLMGEGRRVLAAICLP
jgi:uncharacterized protein